MKKFVINRNDKQYIYAEFFPDKGNSEYYIYQNENAYLMNADLFYSTYGMDKKITIMSYIKNVKSDIYINRTTDPRVKEILINLKKLEEKLKNKPLDNPSLWGYKSTLLKTINIYNEVLDKDEIIENNSYEDYIRYEEIKTLNRENKNTNVA